ncbi:MAG: type II toxin-antitoxin system PemK/MazF family toxin [Candidatus Riflebacteria bacterium]|nr:type II toxin-antitoxin system PemK/MazF family toxin [Candidatus Riflebacteria bacterium]
MIGSNSRETTFLNTKLPKRGEIWLVNLDPTMGAEIKKTRPGLIISSDSIGVLPLKLVAPITEWKEAFSKMIWQVKIEPDEDNALMKISSIDVLQLRSLDTKRIIQFIGKISEDQIKDVCLALSDITETP